MKALETILLIIEMALIAIVALDMVFFHRFGVTYHGIAYGACDAGICANYRSVGNEQRQILSMCGRKLGD